MKKILSLSLVLCVCAAAFSFDRDYTEIQKEQAKLAGLHFTFRDVFGNEFESVYDDTVSIHSYKCQNFIHEGNNLYYRGDDRYVSKMGVDISRHDGKVDFEQLKKDGIEFVILRIGYRGYQSGKLVVDQNFHENIKAAQKAGLEVGVYIFSQAANKKEALEEAKLVVDNLKNYKITLPVFYDPEIIRDDEARSDHITGEQFTKNAITFCEYVKKAGYTPGVYSNMLWEAFEFDLSKFEDYVIWYADYEEYPQTPYRFEFWQYAEKDGEQHAPYDMDIMLIEK